MHSLVYYAILGSLVAGAVGALVLVAVAFTQSLKRFIRLADTVALLCFAVAAGLAIVAVMEQARATSLGVEARDDGQVLDRLHAVETRLAHVEGQQQVARAAPEPAAAEDRIARLERRIDAVESRATRVTLPAPKGRPSRITSPASLRSESVTGATLPQAELPGRPSPTPAPANSGPPEAFSTPTPEPPVTGPSGEPSAASAVAAPTMKAPAGAVTSFTDRLRHDWDELKRTAREGSWRNTWDQLRELLRQ